MLKKRTKIIATLGPSTDDPKVMDNLIKLGLNVVRLNFSHGDHAEHEKRIKLVRRAAAKNKTVIGILADLQGPKIRIARFKKGKVELKKDQTFILDTRLAPDAGDEYAVGIDYKPLIKDVIPLDTLLLDDGRIVLEVTDIKSSQIICRVKIGGVLSNNKGINKLGGGLSAPAITAKDKEDLKAAVAFGVDYIAISFPKDASDIKKARKLVQAANGNAHIIAKMERMEAIKNMDEIIGASDAIMIARGDLAIEVGDAKVPALQKQMMERAKRLNRPVIIATQMMESMISSPIPTRAEVSDVANAVLDSTDAVMLSAETAIGNYPEQVVASMSRVCQAIEESPETQRSEHCIDSQPQQVDEAIAMATVYTANHINIRAIICLTESGSTPRLMSRIRTGIPIYGLSRHESTRGKMTLYRDVYPIDFDVTKIKAEKVNYEAIQRLKKLDLVKKNDLVILTKGDHMGVHGRTNLMEILRVEDLA